MRFIDPDGRYVSSNDSYNAVGTQMAEVGERFEKRDNAESFLTESFSDSGGEISGANFDTGLTYSIGKGISEESFDFQKVDGMSNWRQAIVTDLELEVSNFDRKISRKVYSKVDFDITVGVPVWIGKRNDKTFINPREAAYAAKFAANIAAMATGFRAIGDLNAYWFSSNADLRQTKISKAFAQTMQGEMRTDFGFWDINGIPGSRVRTGRHPIKPNIIPNKAIYNTPWFIRK